jgi:hypothetical protein
VKIPGLTKLGLATAVLIALAAVVPQAVFDLKYTTPLTVDQAKACLSTLRKNMERGEVAALREDLKSVAGETIPVVLTVYSKGIRRSAMQVDGEPLGRALNQLAQGLKRSGALRRDPRLRLQLDFVTAEGWIPRSGLLASLAFVEGRDGISGLMNGRRVYLPPSEMIRNKKYGSFKPFPSYDSNFRVGVDLEKMKKTILHQGERIGIKGREISDLARFRSIEVVEGDDLVPRQLLKGTVERPPTTRSSVRAAVVAGAGYLKLALSKDGTFRYYYNPLSDRNEKGSYNWPRHAGVSYSLALVGGKLHRTDLVAAAKKALERFEEQLTDGPEGSKCLESEGKCYLGSSALGLLALAEHRIASGDQRFDRIMKQVADFLLSMQKPDGFFYHDWYPDDGIDKKLMKLYASQQAVFALARYAAATGDAQALEKAVFGMDYLAGPYWDHFLGGFFFGQEHWTCLAAEEVYNARPKPEYAKLCFDIGVHYDHVTHRPGDTPYSEDVGGMSITHIFTPHLGGTATAAEAMVSAAILGQAIGRDTSSIREQLKWTFGFLMKGQITAHDAFWIRRPELSVGGFYDTQTKLSVRIDNVQHSISAMVRGMDLLPEDSDSSLSEADKDYRVPSAKGN